MPMSGPISASSGPRAWDRQSSGICRDTGEGGVRINFLMEELVCADFALCGILVAAALWLTSHFAWVWFAPMQVFRDELVLLLLITVGAFVYAFSILTLFGRGWIFALRRV